MRTIIIGDIHGCSRPFREVLDRVKPDPASDRLILLGDLFDRGPDSWGVLQMVKELEAAFRNSRGQNADTFAEQQTSEKGLTEAEEAEGSPAENRCMLLRGNHEDYLLQPKLSLRDRFVWEQVGRSATVRSFRDHGEKMEGSAPWLKEHCRMYFKGEDFQCVHAGIKVDPLELNDTYTLLHDHMVVLENRYAGPLTVTGHIALQKPAWFAGDGETIEFLPFGPEGEWRPLPKHGVICIDTGCGKGGILTGMIIRDGEFKLEASFSR